ncbi:MAG: shikimate kinase [Phycisphaerales bacterium]|nr:shikimate kinase [Phycisphaerales bacterium]
MNIALIGLRGSGKTTIGRELAEQLWCDFVDLDDLALARFAESTVSDVWSAHGEAAWREAEVEALGDVLGRSDDVIALGGGAPMIPQAREMLTTSQMADEIKIVYLKAGEATLRSRLEAEPGDRPSLTDAGTIDEIAAILRKRDPVYQDLADQVLDVDVLSPVEAAQFIVRLVM